ncbi:hypothetical protein IHE44_0014999, partial [Lamprotornis superbus]
MAQFLFEADLHGLLKLDTPIPNAPPARWQRKAKESGPGPSPVGVSPMKPANRSHSSSKTPSKTPGKSGSKIQNTPTKAGGDRYIPNRSTMQMEMANFLLTKENDPAEESPTKKEQQKAWAVNLNGFDVEEAKILRLSGKPQNAPEGYQNNLKVLYSQKMTPGSSRKNSRYIPSMPDRILDAPEIRNDYYLNLIDWSSQNFLAVALDNSVYLWNHGSGEIIQLLQMEHPDVYISSVSWIKEGNYLAVGTSSAEVQLWDIQQQKRLRNMTSHCARVGTLSWNSYILSSGARTGHIHHHDVRVAEHHVATLAGHTQEVCGLKWSLDGRYLASGGNDNLVNVWPCTQGGGGDFAPVQTFTQHQGAVKAVAWCPWQMNVLATGGGTSDRHIRIWNVCSGACLSAVDAHSQVCSILWSTNYKEFISGHGFAQNQLVLWKYPTMTKVAELQGHTARILNLTMSPDGTTVASAAADETLRLWRCFEMDPIKKKEKEKANSAKSTKIDMSPAPSRWLESGPRLASAQESPSHGEWKWSKTQLSLVSPILEQATSCHRGSVGFDLAIGDSAIFMDAATVVLGCLLSHPGQPFALGVGLVPKVGEEDEEDGPINPDKVNEDGELVLAVGHEVILGDVDGDNHKLCLGARQSKNKSFMRAGSGNPLETLFLKATPRLLKQEVLMVKQSAAAGRGRHKSQSSICLSPSQHGCSPGTDQHPHPNQAIRGPQWGRAAENLEQYATKETTTAAGCTFQKVQGLACPSHQAHALLTQTYQLDGCDVLLPPQEAHGLLQTSSQEAEDRVPFFPVKSLSTQQPLPLQANTSTAPSASQQEEELNVIFAVGRMAADTSCAELPGTSRAGFARSNRQGALAYTVLAHHSLQISLVQQQSWLCACPVIPSAFLQTGECHLTSLQGQQAGRGLLLHLNPPKDPFHQ